MTVQVPVTALGGGSGYELRPPGPPDGTKASMPLPRFLKFMSQDMAIDLGTANTVVYVR